ncbi:MAG: transposase [Clostridia bacterium]|nr:transposase [Clostridia bacterium]
MSIENAYDTVKVENYIIMPNHIHLLLLIDTYGLPRSSAPTIPNVVTALKKFTNRDCKTNLWQRGYIDHIIRNQTDFERHWNYIEYNALKEYN